MLSNEEFCADPRMILIEQLSAILAFAEEDLSATWMHFCVLSNIIYLSSVNSPAVVLCLVLFDVIKSIEDLIGVGYQDLLLLHFIHEFLKI